MRLAIGTPVRWPNPPIGWRTGRVIEVFGPYHRPDFAPFCDVRRYSSRSVTSYLIRDASGRLWWPFPGGVEATGPAPPPEPITDAELDWCRAHPALVRQAMKDNAA